MEMMKLKNKPTIWDYPVHPAADALPMMGQAQIAELAKDIEANGLRHPFILFRDNTEQANGSEGPFPIFLLDGRGRRDALKVLGVDQDHVPHGRITTDKVRILNAVQQTGLMGGKTTKYAWGPDVDPVEMVMSLNIHRRHLTSEQKRVAIENLIKLNPNASNLSIAHKVGVSPTTVGDVRAKAQNIQSGKNSHLPRERVKEILLANPVLSSKAIAEQAGCSDRTVQKVRKELIDAGEIKAVITNVGPAKPQPVEIAKQALRDDLDMWDWINKEIAVKVGVSETTIRKAKKELLDAGEVKFVEEPSAPIAAKPSTTAEKDAQRYAKRVADAINAMATMAADLRKQAKAVAKFTMSVEQLDIVKGIVTDTREVLGTVPSQIKTP